MATKRWTPKRMAAGSIDLGRRVVCRLLALAGMGMVFGCSSDSATPPEETSDPPGDPPPADPPPSDPPPPEPPPEPEPDGSTVVHVHATGATDWNGETEFWNHVDADVIDRMVDEGMTTLTGKPSVADAWRSLLPSYVTGEVIAIKVNLNNAGSCTSAGPEIDALMEPVNAVVRGLTGIGVAESDIWVYDAVRSVPDRFRNACLFPGVRFFSGDGCSTESAKFDSTDANATVEFSPPDPVPKPSEKITNVVIDATYLINMPILKVHQAFGVTLGFKNHFGTIQRPGDMHSYAIAGGPYFRNDYSVLVDIFRNPHIGAKTILTIGDGLFGTLGSCCSAPDTWKTFDGKVPNSLFFSTDPVAIDCVMYDFLAAETNLMSGADAYLPLAGAAGLGTFEHGDPWGEGYKTIRYVRREI